MWSTRNSYPVVLCGHCSASKKGKCYKCPNQTMCKPDGQAFICPGCAPSKRLKCTKCTTGINGFSCSAYYCELCSYTHKNLCAKCDYKLQNQ